MTLADLSDAVLIDPDFAAFADNQVGRIVAAHEMGDIERAEPGDLVVLDAVLHEQVAGYRFDVAVARVAAGVAGIVGGRPGLTGRRVATGARVAVASLAPGHDVASLAVLLRDLTRGRQQVDVAVLERLVEVSDACTSSGEIDALLAEVSRIVGRRVVLAHSPLPDGPTVPVRVQGAVRWGLVVDDAPGSAILDAALSHLAHHIESILQSDFDARTLPEATRSELVNEILLSEAGTWADAAGRLRQSAFPIDGSHCALRIDCHGSMVESSASTESVATSFRAQQHIGELVLDVARRDGGTWTRAGTSISIVLVSSRHSPHGELVSGSVGETAAEIVAAVRSAAPELEIHVGVGTPHLGVAGLCTSVQEATTAVRSARRRGRANEPQHFDRLGFGRALLQWAEIDGVRPVVDEILAPLRAQPARRAAESLETLRVYLETGRNISATAGALHLHRNTVRYRVDRLRSQLPVDLDDPDERLLVELACRLAASDSLDQ